MITFEYEDGTTETDVYTNVCIRWEDDWVPVLENDELVRLDLERIKAMKPRSDCERLYTSFEEACADTEMAVACAHIRRLKITTLVVDDSIHMHCTSRCVPEDIYSGFTSSGISFKYQGSADVEEELWEHLLHITRNKMGAAP